MKILDLTYGYRKRYAYIKADEFGISKVTLKKQRDLLVGEGILEWTTTRGYTRYELKIPGITENFIFIDGSRGATVEEEEIAEKEVRHWQDGRKD